MNKKLLVKIEIALVILFVIFSIFKIPYFIEIIALLIIVVAAVLLFAKIPGRKEEDKKPTLPLPIKTQIVAWWMIVIGGIGLIIFLIYLMAYFKAASGGGCLTGFVLLPFVGIPSFSIFLPGILILLKKRKGWIASVVILSLGVLLTIFIYFSLSSLGHAAFLDIMAILIILIISIPLILLYLDRKNFWKIAT